MKIATLKKIRLKKGGEKSSLLSKIVHFDTNFFEQ